jgi:hypothetical protein
MFANLFIKNNFFIQENDNKNRDTNEVNWIK